MPPIIVRQPNIEMATCYDKLTVADCNDILLVCKGLKISHVWRSIGPCVFIEIGRLSKERRAKNPRGQVSVRVAAQWRLERTRSIQVGSGFSDPRINNRLRTLVGTAIESIKLTDRLPEIDIDLEDGRRFVTFTNWNSQPQWSIGFKDLNLFPIDPQWSGIDVAPYIHVQSGRTEIEYCFDDTKASVRNAVKRMGFK